MKIAEYNAMLAAKTAVRVRTHKRERKRRNSTDPRSGSILERDVLRPVLEYLQRHRRVVWAQRISTGAGMLLRPDGSQYFIKFGFEGCPDILGQLTDGRLLAVEAKRPKGDRRRGQIVFINAAKKNRAVAGFVESVNDAILLMAQVGF